MFIGWIAFVVQLPIQLFFTVWSGGFFGAMVSSTGIFPDKSSWPFVVFGAIGFLGVPAIAYFGKKLNYERTEYRIYDDRIEFEEGFLTINKKVVKFRDVREVTLRKGVFQRIYGLDSIYLGTLATGSSPRSNPFIALGFGNVSASGVLVRDILDPEAAYDRIRAVVDAAAAESNH